VLTSASDLLVRLETGDRVTLLDVRWRLGGPPGIESYREGHVPGAVFVDLDRDLAAPAGVGGRHPLPSPDDFGAAMRRAGVHQDLPVVCYDDRDGTSAARCWWLLTYFGHSSVSVLDGGLAAWIELGPPLQSEVPAPAPGDFEPSPGHLGLIDADGAAALARRGVLLDARAAARYAGEVEPVDPVAGHVPGALSAPTTENVDADGRFMETPVLSARFARLGITPEVHVGAYCGSGVTAAHEVLALKLAGIDAALYAGSWSDWIADPARPVAQGGAPG
jgi:thiosulfate/3-mercaptopyruvate sulfurtransferase